MSSPCKKPEAAGVKHYKEKTEIKSKGKTDMLYTHRRVIKNWS